MPTPSHAPRGIAAPGRPPVDRHGEVARLHGSGIQRYAGLFRACGDDGTGSLLSEDREHGRPWGEWRDEWTIAPVTGAVA